MKKPEEMLKRGGGNFSHFTDYEDAIEAMKQFGKQCWQAACKAQMDLVFEHCQNSPQGTNGHAIKHWVKIAEFPNNIQPQEQKQSDAIEFYEYMKDYNYTRATDEGYNEWLKFHYKQFKQNK